MTETAISVERKYDAELSWWRDALENTVQWHMGKAKTVWGWPCVPNPVSVVRDPEAAVLSIRKEYLARYPGILDLPVERSYGKLLELGSGPLCPAAVFRSQLLVAVDPLMLRYAAIGYPLHRYQAVCLNARVEDLGSLLPSGMFDTIVSHDAIDHMDCFRRVAQQIKRLARPGATIRLSITYREPTTTEPLRIADADVESGFADRPLTRIAERRFSDCHSRVLWGSDAWPV